MQIVKKYFDVHGKLQTKIAEDKQLVVNWQSGEQKWAHELTHRRIVAAIGTFKNIKARQSKEDVTVCFSPGQLSPIWCRDIKKVIMHLTTPREYDEGWAVNSRITGMTVGWFCGTGKWAYQNVANRITPNLPYKVAFNVNGDVTVLSNPQTANLSKNLSKTVTRLDAIRRHNDKGQVDGLITEEGNMWEDKLKQCGALIATNQQLYDYGKTINENTFFITNGVPLDQFPYVYKIKPTDKFVVGFIGSIFRPEYREHKGYDLVIEACKKTGCEFKEALYKTKQIPVERMVELMYSQMDVLVHPTKSEGCSNVVVEALSCGVPVITTRTCGYHGETLEDGLNVLFCERTVESIVDCINRLKNDYTLRLKLSHNGRRFAEEHHDIKKIAAQWADVIRMVGEKGNAAEEKPGVAGARAV